MGSAQVGLVVTPSNHEFLNDYGVLRLLQRRVAMLIRYPGSRESSDP
jgi:hypothetical protein